MLNKGICAGMILFATFFLPDIAIKSACGAAEPKAGNAAEQVNIVFKNGRLSVNAKSADLAGLLKEVGVKAGVEVTGAVPEEKVTVSFRDLPLEDGLRKILKHNSYFLCRPGDKKSLGEARCEKPRLVIVKRASATGPRQIQPGAALPPQPRTSGGGDDQLNQIISELLSDDAEVRSRGIARLNQGLEAFENVDPEIIGALRLVVGEETRNSGLAGLREILGRSKGVRNARAAD